MTETAAKGRVALVTGANRGIGLEIARQLSSAGYTVIGTARSGAGLQGLRAQMADWGSGEACQLDVTDAASIAAARDWVQQTYGRLDVLVNNAGIAPDQWVAGLALDLDMMRSTFETNLFGVLACSQAFIPMMQAAGYGRVVNVSSELASLGPMEMGSTVAYRTSKTALNALTRLLALELGEDSGIKVNAACPGWVRTELGGPDAIYSVEEGADTPVWLAMLPDDGPTGGLFRQREVYPW